jgi:hypothetical protein
MNGGTQDRKGQKEKQHGLKLRNSLKWGILFMSPTMTDILT